MLSTFCMTAPAGVDGRGSVAVRPSLLAAVRGVEGTGLPIAGMAPRPRGWAAVGTGFDFGVGVARGSALPMTTPQHDQITQYDGTTLGIHSSGRPRS